MLYDVSGAPAKNWCQISFFSRNARTRNKNAIFVVFTVSFVFVLLTFAITVVLVVVFVVVLFVPVFVLGGVVLYPAFIISIGSTISKS